MNHKQKQEELEKGCGDLIPVDPSDKASEGWYCGHYYDSFKRKIYCPKCQEKRKAHKKEVLKDLNECIDVFGLKEELEKVLLRYEEEKI